MLNQFQELIKGRAQDVHNLVKYYQLFSGGDLSSPIFGYLSRGILRLTYSNKHIVVYSLMIWMSF